MKNSKEKGEKHVMNHDEEVTGWTELRPVVWLAAVVLVGVTSSTDYGFIVLCTAIPGAIVYSAACVFIEVITKERRAIETFRKSPIMSYLEGAFTDIDHINSISGSGGLRFDYAQIEILPSGSGSMEVYTTAEKNRTALLRQYHDRAFAYYGGKETRSPEQLRKELMPYCFKETSEYSPKCPHFFNDLREMNSEEINEGGSTRYGFKVTHFMFLCAKESLKESEERPEKAEIHRRAIMKCAKERGYHARYKYLSKDRQYEMTPSLVKRGFTCHT